MIMVRLGSRAGSAFKSSSQRELPPIHVFIAAGSPERGAVGSGLMKRSVRSLTGLAALLLASTASAKDLPNYNAYYDAKPVRPALTPSARQLASVFASSMDEQRGVPTFVWSAADPSLFQSPQIALATHEGAARA